MIVVGEGKGKEKRWEGGRSYIENIFGRSPGRWGNRSGRISNQPTDSY